MLKVFKYSLVLVILLLFRIPFVSAQSNFSPAAVIVESEHRTGMGWVIDKNLVITALHVVTDEDARLIYSATIFFAPSFKKRLSGSVIGTATDEGRDLALIWVNTGDIRPLKLADRVRVGEYVHWNLLGVNKKYKKFQRVSARVVQKEPTLDLSCYSPCKRIYYYEKVAPPVGCELILVVDRDTHKGSSGGVGVNSNGEAIGLMVVRSGGYSSMMVSIDGIKRFLYEHRKEITAIAQITEKLKTQNTRNGLTSLMSVHK